VANHGWSVLGTLTIALDTGLNALASSTGKAISAAINLTATDPQPPLALWELKVTFAAAPTVDSAVELYLLPSSDGGTTFADGGASVEPQTAHLVGRFVVRAITTAHVLMLSGTPLPPGQWKALLKNATNQAFPATGSTLKYATYHPETV